MPEWFKFGKNSGGTRDNFGLTALGKKKAEDFSESTPKNKVLAFINENGTSTLPDIAQGIGSSTQKTKLILKSLQKDGYVRVAGQEE